FVVTGDHGFVDINLSLAPNVWLARAGLMEARPDRGRWRATFHTSGGAATLILNDPKDTEAVERVRRILAELPTRTRGLFRVVDREELERIGADPGAPLALAGSIGVSFSNRAEGDALAPASGGTHGFFPTDFPEIYTGMIGWGAGFRRGVRIHEMGLEDVAPLIAELLGIPFDAPDGVAPLGVLTPVQD
ncbi:alkaline phosphatase family protein, partial [Candidatus Sumerlaeota bacterium]|nr:alkaline phosphatase family protein [Candidatus Sumerlaeota bacterium]